MKINDIPWHADCHGRLAEFEVSSGWLRVRALPEGYRVTRFGKDKQLVAGPVDATADELAALLA